PKDGNGESTALAELAMSLTRLFALGRAAGIWDGEVGEGSDRSNTHGDTDFELSVSTSSLLTELTVGTIGTPALAASLPPTVTSAAPVMTAGKLSLRSDNRRFTRLSRRRFSRRRSAASATIAASK
ncbi:hypothetical protein Vafri_13672, partial [Volvox africanus]